MRCFFVRRQQQAFRLHSTSRSVKKKRPPGLYKPEGLPCVTITGQKRRVLTNYTAKTFVIYYHAPRGYAGISNGICRLWRRKSRAGNELSATALFVSYNFNTATFLCRERYPILSGSGIPFPGKQSHTSISFPSVSPWPKALFHSVYHESALMRSPPYPPGRIHHPEDQTP